MLTKLDTKSARVKGICFHPSRSWVLASLHSGVIQLWDYRMGILLDKFDEHDGPVRGIHFHPNQPLFVSGGDDYKIKVWNYKLKRCLFTLLGHLDYIRSTFFHHEQPWILSCSDDQTCRIWNWQSRACLTILTGHNHYVMCAQFHPSQDLVASASLDQTVRIWDTSGLRSKSSAGSAGSLPGSSFESKLSAATGQTDLFGSSDTQVLHVLEGHDRGVNWVAWHGGGMPLLASAADDRQVKLWRLGDNRAWEVDACRGHYSNVNCAIFHPKQEIILSASEDHTVKLWDVQRRTALHTFRREERFWVLAAHPQQNIFAAGHDQGFIVFKLERERPPYAMNNNVLYYIKERYIRRCYLENDGRADQDVPIIGYRRQGGSGGANLGTKGGTPFTLQFNPAEKALLLCSNSNNTDSATYELFNLPKGVDDIKPGTSPDFMEGKKGNGCSAVWIARNRFAVLDGKSGHIHIKNLKNEISKTLGDAPQCDRLFFAGIGKLLLRQTDKCQLYDIQQKKVLQSARITRCRYTVWSQDGSKVALLAKHTLVACDKNLKVIASIKEASRVKSAAWDENGVLLYTTSNHIKYCLPNGDQGTIRTLDVPVYLTIAYGDMVHCLDRQSIPRSFQIDSSEYKFKLALLAHRYEEVIRMVRSSRLVGQSIIAYLRKNGYAEVALQFVKDEKTRFNLALESGNIEIALDAAKKLDDIGCWHRLTQLALRQGKHLIVEICYQRTKQFNKLSFLYFTTGSMEKLSKMLKISDVRKDASSMYQNALLLGDVEERIRALRIAGQNSLAYLTAQTHGLKEIAQEIAESYNLNTEEIQPLSSASILNHAPPILPLNENWPLLHVSKSIFHGLAEKSSNVTVLNSAKEAAGLIDDDATQDGWVGADDLDGLGPDDDVNKGELSDVDDSNVGGWDVDVDDLNLPDDFLANSSMSMGSSAEGIFVPPSAGTSQAEVWVSNSPLCGDHIMAGSFRTAARILNEQIGCVELTPFKESFIRHYTSSRIAIPGLPNLPPMRGYVHRNWKVAGARGGFPSRLITVDGLLAKLQVAYKLTTAGKFQEAVLKFRNVLLEIPTLSLDTKKEVQTAEEMLGICREYVLGLSLELYRRNLPKDSIADQIRLCELAAYFTHCDILPVHQMLTLRTASNLAFKLKNFKMAASFSRRLLELGPKPEMATNAKKIIQACGNDPKNEHDINYDEHNPFQICAATYQPIYRGKPTSVCPFTSTAYIPEHSGRLDCIAEVSEVGKKCSGIKLSLYQFK